MFWIVPFHSSTRSFPFTLNPNAKPCTNPSSQELRITAVLFGGLIQHQLVSSITLTMALNYVMDALRKEPGSKMFAFGVGALRQFVASMPQWPQHCMQMLQVRA